MKRIKVAQNRFLTLFRLESESGSTTSYELERRTNYPIKLLAIFKPADWKRAAHAFTIATCILKTTGLQTRSMTIKRVLDRSADLSAGIRRFKSRYRKHKPKRKTTINPI